MYVYVYVSMMYICNKWLLILEHVFWLLGESMGYRWPSTVGYNNHGMLGGVLRCMDIDYL